jgi:hypothetical protein
MNVTPEGYIHSRIIDTSKEKFLIQGKEYPCQSCELYVEYMEAFRSLDLKDPLIN